MKAKQQIAPGEKIGLKLTQAERTVVVEGLTLLPAEYEDAVHGAAPNKPIMLTLDELDDLGGYVAAEANHCDDRQRQKKLDVIFEKIQHLLDTYTDEASPATLSIQDAKQAKVVANSAVQVAEWAAKALIAAEQLGIKTKPIEHLWLAPAQRDVLLLVPGVSKAIKNKLAKERLSFTVAEVAGMTMALADDLLDGDARKQLAVLLVARHLMDCLQEAIAGGLEPKTKRAKKPKVKTGNETVYQFKITLQETKPPIWRRIQVKDCTLEKLHEHIQTAMGWTNSHLHRFEIGDKRYGDPDLFEEDFQEFGYIDSTRTLLSQVLPKSGKRCRLTYEYDFGDGWMHEVLFEGQLKPAPRKKYPICLEGERACPPEDVGGVWGYAEFLAALADPQHGRHDELLEWAGPFDQEQFDANSATKAMKKGLPNWRV